MDRFIEDGTIYRIHQEDFCQAAGILPSRKYQNEGGPGISTCINLINRFCSIPVVEKEKFIKWIIFNYLIGNCDAHGKNISLLFTIHGTELAPFYDLLSTTVYPELSKKMSMKLGGKKRIDWVLNEHWVRFAQETDIKFSMLKEILIGMANKLQKHSEELKDEFSHSYGENDIINKICKFIDSQTKLLV